jgi:hypothetical protein
MLDGAVQDTMELTQMLSFLHDGIPEEIFHQAWTGLWDGGNSG